MFIFQIARKAKLKIEKKKKIKIKISLSMDQLMNVSLQRGGDGGGKEEIQKRKIGINSFTQLEVGKIK